MDTSTANSYLAPIDPIALGTSAINPLGHKPGDAEPEKSLSLPTPPSQDLSLMLSGLPNQPTPNSFPPQSTIPPQVETMPPGNMYQLADYVNPQRQLVHQPQNTQPFS